MKDLPAVLMLIGLVVACAFVIRIGLGKPAPPPPPLPPINPQIICPHCQTRGRVRTANEIQKMGISGAKATKAILTSGVSLLFVGLARKQATTRATCGHCGSSWHFT
jgi:hypothetical protein